ncbi:hypothetical protein [Immundisolibacter sp.]|uniref:hypothetical protein n=1 Tax=Immundisolibacter sp. TaxID=1934948 RepID=UPI003F838707
MTRVFVHTYHHADTGHWNRRLGLLLILALLLGGQTAAMRHALGHLVDACPNRPALPTHTVCVLCVGYAVADCALAASPPVAWVATEADAINMPRSVPTDVPVPLLPYQVRAPPPALA